MLIIWIARSHHISNGGRRSIMQIRRGAPNLNQCGGIEFVSGFIIRNTRADIVRMQIRIEPGSVTFCAAASCENLFAPPGCPGQLATNQEWARQRLE